MWMENIAGWSGLGNVEEQGRHHTGTTGGNSLHPTLQWMTPDNGKVSVIIVLRFITVSVCFSMVASKRCAMRLTGEILERHDIAEDSTIQCNLETAC